MKQLRTIVRMLSFHFLVLLLGTPAFAGGQCSLGVMPSVSGALQPVVTQVSADVRLVQYHNGVTVEQLQGESALRHLQNSISRHPQAFVAARKELEKRGFHPTNQVFVERTLRNTADRVGGASSLYSLVQTSMESNSDGEIAFWSYDGDPSVWTGTIYVEIYSTGEASTWDGQLDTTTTDYPWNWQTKTWEGNVKDGGPLPIKFTRSQPGNLTNHNGIQSARLVPESHNGVVLTSFYNWAVCWRATVVGGCAGAAVSCLNSGPGWPGCWGARCLGAEIAGAIGCALMR